MSRIASKKFPDRGDLVIGVVNKIASHGVYVTLTEYEGVEGYIHVGEITGAWVRNIRNYVRQDQQVVGKVIKVKRDIKQIDISLKRVSTSQKKQKINEYRKQNSALALLKIIADKLQMKLNVIRELLEAPFIEEYGTLHNGFEELAFSGIEVLEPLNLDPKTAQVIYESAVMSVQISTVEIIADLAVRSFAPDGVEQVKRLLRIAEEAAKPFDEVMSKIITVGSPQYKISLEGRSYPELSEVYNAIEKALEVESKSLSVEYRISQQKSKSR